MILFVHEAHSSRIKTIGLISFRSGIRAAPWDNIATSRFESQQYKKIEQQAPKLTPFNKHGSSIIGYRPPPKDAARSWNQSIQHGSALPFIRQQSDPLHKDFDHNVVKLASSSSFKTSQQLTSPLSSAASTQILDNQEVPAETSQSAPSHAVANVIDYEHTGTWGPAPASWGLKRPRSALIQKSTPKSRRFDTDSDQEEEELDMPAPPASSTAVPVASTTDGLEEQYAWSCCLSTVKRGKGCVGRVIARPDTWNLDAD